MKVLHILEATAGGTRRHILDLLPALRARGIACDLAYSPLRNPQFPEDAAGLARQGVGVYEVPMTRGWGGRQDAVAWRALHAHLRTHHYDLIHCHSTKAGFLGRMLQAPVQARARRTPVVYTPHCIAFDTALPAQQRRAARVVEQLLAPLTSHFIAVSHHEFHMMRAARLCTTATASVIHNGIDLAAFDTAAQSQESAIRNPQSAMENSPLTIGCLGRLTRQKNQLALLRALSQLHRVVPDARLLLIGGGEDEAMLRRMAQEICVSKHVVWVGEVQEARPYYALCDIVAQPSRWEGCPYSILEAMSARCAVIATAVGGVPELIPASRPARRPAGLTYKTHEPAELAAGLIDLATHEELRACIGTTARQRVADHFQLEQMVAKTVITYQQSLSRQAVL